MVCKKCGAVIMGKYCVNCGKRAHTDAEDEFLALQRAKRDYVHDRASQHKWELSYIISAKFAWALAERFYEDKHDKLLNKKDCPPSARFDIEREAECIAKILDGIIYRSKVA